MENLTQFIQTGVFDETPIDFFGCLKDTVTIKEDIINPIEASWETNERV